MEAHSRLGRRRWRVLALLAPAWVAGRLAGGNWGLWIGQNVLPADLASFRHVVFENERADRVAGGSPTGFSRQHAMALSSSGRDPANSAIFAGK